MRRASSFARTWLASASLAGRVLADAAASRVRLARVAVGHAVAAAHRIQDSVARGGPDLADRRRVRRAAQQLGDVRAVFVRAAGGAGPGAAADRHVEAALE